VFGLCSGADDLDRTWTGQSGAGRQTQVLLAELNSKRTKFLYFNTLPLDYRPLESLAELNTTGQTGRLEALGLASLESTVSTPLPAGLTESGLLRR